MTQDERQNLSKNIERLLQQNQISRYRLAKELGVTYRTIYNWLDCVCDISKSHLYDIANFFSVSVSDLLQDNNDNDIVDKKLYQQISELTSSLPNDKQETFLLCLQAYAKTL